MKIEDFFEKFAETLDMNDANLLTPDTYFRELDEWSSLAALGVIAMADEEFNVELTGTELRSAETIQDLYDLICSK